MPLLKDERVGATHTAAALQPILKGVGCDIKSTAERLKTLATTGGFYDRVT